MSLAPFIIKWLIYALITYLLLMLAMYLLQGKLLFHPTAKPPSPLELGLKDFDEVKITTSDNVEISGWFHHSTKSKKAVIYFYGNADTLENYPHFFRIFADNGYSVLAINYRGYAGTKGKISEEGLYKDADAALAFIKKYVEEKDITLIGRSLGTGVATDLASRNNVGGLVLVSPYTSINSVASGIYWYLPVKYLSRYKFASIEKIKKINAPLLIIHGRDDGLIPLQESETLLAAANEPKKLNIYEYGGHNDLSQQQIALDVIEFERSNHAAQ